jgi:chromosome segregation ATPase
MSSSVQITALKDDAEQARAEQALCEEREQLLQLEVLDLQRQRNELQSVLDKANEEHAAALAPQIASLRTDVQMVEMEIQAESGKLTDGQAEVCDNRQPTPLHICRHTHRSTHTHTHTHTNSPHHLSLRCQRHTEAIS